MSVRVWVLARIVWDLVFISFIFFRSDVRFLAKQQNWITDKIMILVAVD